ncbi:MAG: hypothetical protein ACYC5Q_14795 [Thermoleophilia bacterium]
MIRDPAGGYDGVLFVMNSKGEPLEFVYSRIETPRTLLWRRRDLGRRAARELTTALFGAATSRPSVILAKADEVEPGFFVTEVETPIATCRVAGQMASVSMGPDEHGEDVDAEGLHLLWSSGSPQEGSAERALVEALQSAGLLTEPFERAEAGLREARGEDVSGLGSAQ